LGGGHGGLIELFGAHDFNRREVPDRPGVFEEATAYFDKTWKRIQIGPKKLAPDDPKIDFSCAGVAFLDEFDGLAPHLQHAILDALEAGVIRRQGSGKPVPIGCHVILATNTDLEDLVGDAKEVEERVKRLREDIIDRVPIVARVPALRERTDDEVEELVRALAEDRLLRYLEDEEIGRLEIDALPEVDISPSALKSIKKAISMENPVIRTIRDLQSIADVEPGEEEISDGNLADILEKAEILNSGLDEDFDEIPLSTKAAELDLPRQLHTDELPESTGREIERLYRRYKRRESIIGIAKLPIDQRSKRVLCFLVNLIEVAEKRSPLHRESEEAIRKNDERAYKALGLRLKNEQGTKLNHEERKKQKIAFLLNDA